MQSFIAAGIQMSCTPDIRENMEKTFQGIAEAASKGADIVCLQELYRSPYLCQSEDVQLFDLAEPVSGPSTEAISRIARDKKVAVLVPIFEQRAPGIFHNSIVVIDKTGESVGLYRKMHIPDDPAYYEKYYFTPGDLGFRAFDTQAGRIGTLICWDQWFPEAARLTALQGAGILFYPTAIGWHPQEKEEFGTEQRDAWRTAQRAHAIANGVFVAAVNRVGHEPSPTGGAGIEFWGSSFICDPFGKILAEAPVDKETILYAEIDLKRLESVRRHWPFLRDRRIDAYGDINRRFLDQPGIA